MNDERKVGIHASYSEPVRHLLTIGEPAPAHTWREWVDYRTAFSITEEHIADLARMSLDPDLNDFVPEAWARVHAWRALGQFGTEAVIEPLAALLDASEDDEWTATDLPDCFGMIGSAAIPVLKAFVDDQSRSDFATSTAINALKEIGLRHQQARATCIMILTSIFKQEPARSPFINGSVVADLLDLRAVESIEDMREAFDRQIVDPSVAGDMEDVEIDLGLKTIRSSPRPFYPLFPGHTPEMFQRAKPREPAVSTKTGRNDPCPCGSGKKYKKCCLA